MMKKIAALIGVLLLLGGCEQSKIKSSIAEDMKDPSSVKFGKFIWIENDGPREDCGPQFPHNHLDRFCPIACVEVNAKNSYGGYTGEKIYLVKKAHNADYYLTNQVYARGSVDYCAEKYATENY
jgi:hypothetical protein